MADKISRSSPSHCWLLNSLVRAPILMPSEHADAWETMQLNAKYPQLCMLRLQPPSAHKSVVLVVIGMASYL